MADLYPELTTPAGVLARAHKGITGMTMKTLRAIMLGLAIGIVAQFPAVADQPSAGGEKLFAALQQHASCNRACLVALMDRYLQALSAHDPSRLPLSKQVRFTENTNEMALGDGLWQTAGNVLPERLVIADPSSAQVVFYGGVMENGGLSLLNVRLKALGGQITEIETAVVRKFMGNFGNFTKMEEPQSAWNEALEPSQRRSRQELIALTNQYFEGIEQSSGSIVPFDKDCVRWENNTRTSPSAPQPDSTAPHSAGTLTTRDIVKGLTVSESFDTHLFSYIVHITDRRFLLVDEERGIVYATVMFQHPGNVRFVDVPGKGRVELTGTTSANPNTTEILEAFRLKDGKITNIHAYVSLLPYRQKPGW